MALKYVTSYDGTKIHIDVRNPQKPSNKHSDPTLLFIHSLGSNKTIWQHEIHYFNKIGYKTIAMDIRGHGLSDKPEEISNYAMNKLCTDVKAIIKSEKIKSVVLIGYSLGGFIALHCVCHIPKQIKAIVAISSPVRFPKKYGKLSLLYPIIIWLVDFVARHEHIRKDNFKHIKEFNFVRMYKKNMLHDLTRIFINAPLKSILACFKYATLEGVYEPNYVKDLLESIKAPTLLISGDKDLWTGLEDEKFIASHIPKSQLKILNADHLILFEMPYAVSTMIHRFLREVHLAGETKHAYKRA